MAHAIGHSMQMSALANASGDDRVVGSVDGARTALEIVPVWMNTVMQVAHLVPGEKARPYVVGESPGSAMGLCPEQLAGHDSWTLVRADGTVHVPPGADEIELRRADGTVTEGSAVASITTLDRGDRMRLKLGPVVFVIRAVAAARTLKLPLALDWSSFGFTGASLVMNLAILALAYFFPANSDVISHDTDFEQSRWGKLLAQPVELRVEELPPWMRKAEDDPRTEGGDGEKHTGDEGQMGDSSAKKSDKMYGIKGDAAPSERQMAKMQRDQIAKTGILSALSQSLNMPTSPFGAATAMGSDHENALGALMGTSVGPNFGFGGLGMVGSGDGGGGTGEGTLGLGHGVWTKIGHGAGGDPSGVGYCTGGLCGGGLKKKGPTKVPPKVDINGHGQVLGCLSKEAIRRVIRQHLNEVKHCYEKGLMSQPDLEGRVTVKFSIKADGSVGSAKVEGSTLGDAKVGQCVASSVERWAFSPLEGCGVVVVSYPFSFVPAQGQ